MNHNLLEQIQRLYDSIYFNKNLNSLNKKSESFLNFNKNFKIPIKNIDNNQIYKEKTNKTIGKFVLKKDALLYDLNSKLNKKLKFKIDERKESSKSFFLTNFEEKNKTIKTGMHFSSTMPKFATIQNSDSKKKLIPKLFNSESSIHLFHSRINRFKNKLKSTSTSIYSYKIDGIFNSFRDTSILSFSNKNFINENKAKKQFQYSIERNIKICPLTNSWDDKFILSTFKENKSSLKQLFKNDKLKKLKLEGKISKSTNT